MSYNNILKNKVMEQEIQQLMKRVAWLEHVVAQLNNRIVKLEKKNERGFPAGKINDDVNVNLAPQWEK